MSKQFNFFGQRYHNNVQSLKSFKIPTATRQSIVNNSLSNLVFEFSPEKFIKILETKHITEPRSVFSQKIIVFRGPLLINNLKICLKLVSQISSRDKRSVYSIQKNINHITTVKIKMNAMLSEIDRIIGYVASFQNIKRGSSVISCTSTLIIMKQKHVISFFFCKF